MSAYRYFTPFFFKVILILTLLPMFGSAMAQEERRLVILNAYNEGAPWAQDIITPIMQEISRRENFRAAEVVHLNSTLIHNATDYNNMSDGVFHRYSDAHPDYVVLVGNFAFTLRDRIVREWGDVPMLLISQSDLYGPQDFYYTDTDSIDDSVAYPLLPLETLRNDYNFTIVMVPNLYEQTIDMMAYMFPEMNKLVFIADALYINRYLSGCIRKYLGERYPSLEYEWLVGNQANGEKLQRYLNDADYNTGLLLSTWFFERMTVHGYPQLIAGEARTISGVHRPVFGLREPYFRYGITGGYFPSPDMLHAYIQKGLHDLISDKDMRKVPFLYVDKAFPMIDYEQLTRDGISVDACPPGTVFLNRPKTAWELYRVHIIAIMVILIAVITVAVIIALFQRRKIAFLSAHNRLVNNMPIGYTQATVVYGGEGIIDRLEYHGGNETFCRLVKGKDLPIDSDEHFEDDFLPRLSESLRGGERDMVFPYHFTVPDTYYEFIMYVDEAESRNPVREINIFVVDTTAKSRTDRQLRELVRKLDMTLDVARIIPWRWDLKKHEIACEIQRVAKHDGFEKGMPSRQDLKVMHEDVYFSMIHPEDLERVVDTHHQLTVGTIRTASLEYRLLYGKGGEETEEWIEVSAMVTEYDEDNMPSVLIGSMLVITERKRQEAMLIDARERALESDKLKMAFLANMSHEIRTPLNAIVGFSNLLCRTDDAEKRERFVNIIETNNQLLLKLIGDVLDVAKVESNTLDFNIRPTDLNQLLIKVDDMMKLKIPAGVVLNHVFDAPQAVIETDSNRLSQVLVNLLNNAVKFTPKGCITFGYELREDNVYFYVRDTGIGIPEEDLDKVFTRFTKLNNFVQGNGLGLSISKSIVEKLGGEIGVESAGRGKGTLFWFTLPVKPMTSGRHLGGGCDLN